MNRNEQVSRFRFLGTLKSLSYTSSCLLQKLKTKSSDLVTRAEFLMKMFWPVEFLGNLLTIRSHVTCNDLEDVVSKRSQITFRRVNTIHPICFSDVRFSLRWLRDRSVACCNSRGTVHKTFYGPGPSWSCTMHCLKSKSVLLGGTCPSLFPISAPLLCSISLLISRS